MGGSGGTGKVSVTYTSSDHNKLVLVALEDDRMAALVQAVRQLRDRLVDERLGHRIPFKAFVQPCEAIL